MRALSAAYSHMPLSPSESSSPSWPDPRRPGQSATQDESDASAPQIVPGYVRVRVDRATNFLINGQERIIHDLSLVIEQQGHIMARLQRVEALILAKLDRSRSPRRSKKKSQRKTMRLEVVTGRFVL